jgi:hypothetical protein
MSIPTSTPMTYLYIHERFRDDEDDDYNYVVYTSKLEAYQHLFDDYYPLHIEDDEDEIIKHKDEIIKWLSCNDTGLFKWEWKRRGSYDRFWVVCGENDRFYSVYPPHKVVKIKDVSNILKLS